MNIKNLIKQSIKIFIPLVLFILFDSCTKYKEKTLQNIGYWDVVFEYNKYNSEPYYGLVFKGNKYYIYNSNRHYEFYIRPTCKDCNDNYLFENVLLPYGIIKDSFIMSKFKEGRYKIDEFSKDSVVLSNSDGTMILKPSKYTKIIKNIEKDYK
jgi:hypothetical protein